MTKRVLMLIGIVAIVFLGTVVIKSFNKNIFLNPKGVKMKITTVFSDKEKIPAKYTCDGDDISPELLITDVPAEAKSLVLIVDDPDAPMGNFTHWLLYNIPVNTTKISSQSIPKGAVQGINDFARLNYGGPCPPSGIHRYFFKLYAIDKVLDLNSGATKSELEKAIKSHVIKKFELIGLYSRKR